MIDSPRVDSHDSKARNNANYSHIESLKFPNIAGTWLAHLPVSDIVKNSNLANARIALDLKRPSRFIFR
jgi:hypothetical protein